MHILICFRINTIAAVRTTATVYQHTVMLFADNEWWEIRSSNCHVSGIEVNIFDICIKIITYVKTNMRSNES